LRRDHYTNGHLEKRASKTAIALGRRFALERSSAAWCLSRAKRSIAATARLARSNGDVHCRAMPNRASEADPPPPPASVTHFGLCLVVLGFSVATAVALKVHPIAQDDAVLVLCASVALPVIVLDVLFSRVHRRESTGMAWDRPWDLSVARALTKLVGLAATLVPFALGYWVFPEYRGNLYGPFYRLLERSWPVLAVLVPIYVALVDAKMREPRDVYWKLGRLVLGQKSDLKASEAANHYRSWLVKAFFFPFMFAWLGDSTRSMMTADLTTIRWGNLPFDLGRDFAFFVDLLFCTVGYALSLRPLDTHVRSAEPTTLGWVVALFCYPPFFDKLFDRQYVPYGASHFGKLLAGHPPLMAMCSTAILGLLTVYSLATVAFGLRFSNLTHRGILTNGPYRWSKHPAYVTKNLSWWLTTLPFVVTDDHPWNAVKRCVMLALVNLIYFLRARTEERHLSRDPTYVAYALWMNEYGVLRFLNRIPGIRYVPPRVYTAPAHGE
jgi:protein-S-isoprenylcysteine O-methyltransferase Ste14